MTHHRDIERVLELWLDAGADQMPDRVFSAVLDRVEREPQHRAWSHPRRDSTMQTYLKPVLAMAAVIVVAVAGVVFLIQPGGSAVGGAPASPTASIPTATPTPTIAPSAAPSLAWDTRDNPCGQLGCGGPQAAGTYTSRSLKPPVTYTLTSPWVNVRDWPDFFMLYPDTPENRAVAAAGGYPPFILVLPGPLRVSPSAACLDSNATDWVQVDAAAFAEFLTSQDGVMATAAPTTLGSLTGQEVIARVTPDWTGCLPLTPLGKTTVPRDQIRYIVLDRPGDESIAIVLWYPAPNQPFLEDASAIVQSFEVGAAK